jgi:signal-transduction protein with cAMP-binding, CBS, and nucleotidyltransferase domain
MLDPLLNQMKHFHPATCREETTLLDAARRMIEEDRSALIVVDESECLVGILSRTDLLRAKVEHGSWMDEPVERWMSEEVVTIPAAAHLSEVARLLLERRIHQVVAVEEKDGRPHPVAVISNTDVIYQMTKEQYFSTDPDA